MNEKLEGYICPGCRMLFSLPKGLGGNGANCPGCDELLTIPAAEDGVLSQGVSKVSYQQAGLDSREINSNEGYKEGQWVESRRVEVSKVEENDKALRWMLPIGLAALLLLGGVAYFVWSAVSDTPDKAETPRRGSLVSEDDKEKNGAVEKFDYQSRAGNEKFLTYLNDYYGAGEVEKLIGYCRESGNLKEKMLKFYKGNEVPKKKIKKVGSIYAYGRMPGFYSYKAETTDYDIERGIFEYKDGEFKLDWESKYAYSEMTWAEMKKNKPVKPVTLRVIVKKADYYNLAFKDESKWQSVTISNPNEDEGLIYAYVKKNSAVEQQVSNFGMSNDGYAVILKAHYPENATSDNQVIISEVISDSWIQK